MGKIPCRLPVEHLVYVVPWLQLRFWKVITQATYIILPNGILSNQIPDELWPMQRYQRIKRSYQERLPKYRTNRLKEKNQSIPLSQI